MKEIGLTAQSGVIYGDVNYSTSFYLLFYSTSILFYFNWSNKKVIKNNDFFNF